VGGSQAGWEMFVLLKIFGVCRLAFGLLELCLPGLCCWGNFFWALTELRSVKNYTK